MTAEKKKQKKKKNKLTVPLSYVGHKQRYILQGILPFYSTSSLPASLSLSSKWNWHPDPYKMIFWKY